MKHFYCNVLYIFLYCFSLVWRCVISNCGSTYTASSGEIRPPDNYRGNFICSPYTIRLPVGKRIQLHWHKFNFGGIMPFCLYDFMRISTCTYPVKNLIRYCGPLLPNDFYSYGNCIKIDFRSGDRWKGRFLNNKFLLRYETLDVSTPLYPVQSPPDCLNTRESRNTETVFTPNWPLSYSGYLKDDVCKTTITLKGNWKMKILFMGIDTYTPFRTNPRLCEDTRNDVLTITTYRREDSQSRDLYYCGKQKPFTRYYDDWLERIDITFKAGTSDVHNHTGIALGVMMFDHTGHSTDQNWKIWKPSGTMLAIIIFCLWLCVVQPCLCLRRLRKKSAEHGGFGAYINFLKEERKSKQDRQPEIQLHPILNAITASSSPAPPYPPPNYVNMQDGGITPRTYSAPPSVTKSAHQPPPAIPPPYPSAPPSYGAPENGVPHPNATPTRMPHYGVTHPSAPPLNNPHSIQYPNSPSMNTQHYSAPHSSADNPPPYQR